MSTTKKWISGLMAGFSISLGGMAFLLIADKTVGSIFFSIGILMVANFNSMLFTRVMPLCGYTREYRWTDALIAYVSNAVGATLGAAMLFGSRAWPTVKDKLQTVVETKCDDSLLSLFLLGILCAALVAYGVLLWKRHNDNKVAQMVYLAFCIAVFVVCGFDHIIANFFYYALYLMAFGYRANFVLSLLAVTVGNMVGGFGIGAIQRYMES